MALSLSHVRSAARALIIQDGCLLAVAMRDAQGDFFILPGGGQKHGETLLETIHRECVEELGVAVEAGELLYVREYIGSHHDFRKKHKGFHQLESVFRCRLKDPKTPFPVDNPTRDKLQIGVVWLPLKDLAQARFYPQAVKPFFKDGDFHIEGTLYLGDIN